LFARVDIGVTEFPTKTAEKEEEEKKKRKRRAVNVDSDLKDFLSD